MNHRTPIEDFRARIAALSREQLIEAMHYLRGYNSFAMDRALELVAMPAGVEDGGTIVIDLAAPPPAEPRRVGVPERMPIPASHYCDDPEVCEVCAPAPAALPRVHVHLFGQDGICAQCDLDIVTWSQAQGDLELDHIAIEGTRS